MAQKTFRLVLDAAEQLQVPLPLVGLLRDRFFMVLANEGVGLEWLAIGALAAKDAGLAKG